MKTALNRLLSYEQPQKYIVETENYSETFSTPVLTAGKSFILGYTNETTGVYNGKESPVIIFDDFTGDKKYVDFDFKVKSSAMKLLHKVNTSDNLKYLFYALQSIKYTPFSHKRIWISEYSNFLIEYRHPQEQNAIVLALDGINQAIYNKKQELFSLDELVKSRFIEMFENKGFPQKTGKELFKFSSGKFLPSERRLNSGIPVYGGNGIAWYTDTTLIPFDTLVIGRVGAYCGNVRLVKGNKWITDNALYISSFKTKDYSLEFLEELMKMCNFHQFADASAQPKITQKPLENLTYIIPPIELQNEFAEFVKLIDKSKFVCHSKNFLCDIFTFSSSTIAYPSVVSIFVCPKRC